MLEDKSVLLILIDIDREAFSYPSGLFTEYFVELPNSEESIMSGNTE